MANKTLKSVQEIQNLGFDDTYNISQVEALVYNSGTENLDRLVQPVKDSTATNGTQKTQIVDAGGEQVTITDGKLDVNASVSTTGLATSTIQTNATQKTQIVDSAGANYAALNPLPVSATIDTTGLATTTTDTNTGTIAGDTTSIDGKVPALGQALMVASTPVVIASNQSGLPVTGTFWQATQPVSGTFWQATQPVSFTGSGDVATQTTLAAINTKLATGTVIGDVNLGAADSTNLNNVDTAVTAMNAKLVTGTVIGDVNLGAADATNLNNVDTAVTAMNAKLVTGTDIGDVTINNAVGAASVNIQDGGNTITVDGTVAANATLTAETTKVIGTVNIAAAQTLATVTTVGAVTGITNALPTGANAIGKLATNSGVDIGDVDVLSIAAGTNAIGNVGIVPRTTGGATPYKLVSAATTNATTVKASAGQVFMVTASNVNAAVRYLKFYNKASAPTVGTDTPVFTFAIPGNTAGAGTNIPVPDCGIAFGTGISFALTTESTDAGTTGVAANEIVINMAYI